METHNGFTLIELLVVISITTILAAVLIPNLLNARRAATETNAQQLTRHIATLAEIKRADNNYLSFVTNITGCAPLFISNLPKTVESCKVYQDSNGTYVLSKSSNHNFYFFDGGHLQGPLVSPPANW